jgi:hypothetical protein
MVTRSDVVTLSDTDLYRFRNNVAVPPELIDSNNDAIRAVLNTAVQFVIDKVVATDEENTFSENQIFSDGLKVALIEALTTNGNITLSQGSGNTIFSTTGELYKGSASASNALQTLSQIQTLISTTVDAGIDLILAPTQISNFNAVIGTLYPIDTSGGAFTGTLPATATTGDIIGFYDEVGSTVTNNFTIAYNGNDIQDLAEDMDCNVNYFAVYLIFDTVKGWHLI